MLSRSKEKNLGRGSNRTMCGSSSVFTVNDWPLQHKRQVELYNEEMKDEILVTRRATYKAEEAVSNLEKDKGRQDLLIDGLMDQVRNHMLYPWRFSGGHHEPAYPCAAHDVCRFQRCTQTFGRSQANRQQQQIIRGFTKWLKPPATRNYDVLYTIRPRVGGADWLNLDSPNASTEFGETNSEFGETNARHFRDQTEMGTCMHNTNLSLFRPTCVCAITTWVPNALFSGREKINSFAGIV